MTDDNPRLGQAAVPHLAPPAVPAAFDWTRESWGHALRAAGLHPLAQHLFTSAQLRLPAGATHEERERAWHAVAGSLGASRGQLFRVRQVHGRQVRVIAADDGAVAEPSDLPDGDALASNLTGAVLAVVVADCVPVLLVDPGTGSAAAVHAGWRGTSAAVTAAAVEAMHRHFAVRPEDIVAAIGPSIGPDDYQVGESVLEAFRSAGHDERTLGRWFSRRNGRLTLDLWQANEDQLTAAGVRAERIQIARLSTLQHPGWLESYRRDGEAAGRMVAAIVVPPGRG